MFCVAFGLSMDYGVFLLSRVKEEYDRTGDHERSVRLGLQRTGGLIIAAAIMRLTGKATWWAPGPLRRCHERFGLSEGELETPEREAPQRGAGLNSICGYRRAGATSHNAPEPALQDGPRGA